MSGLYRIRPPIWATPVTFFAVSYTAILAELSPKVSR